MDKDYQYTKININKIKPYEKNARIHNSEQIKQIMEAIKAFGFTNPLLIDDENNLIAGHGRLEAVKQLNSIDFKDNPLKELPAIIITGLSEADKKALIIADNKIAENASWDFNLLSEELKELEYINYDLDLLGFDNLDELLNFSPTVDIDEDLSESKSDDNTADTDDINNSMFERFIVAPFSVISLRSVNDEVNKWRERGIKVGGRGENNKGTFSALKNFTKKIQCECKANEIAESIFNPYLCEILHKWFNLEKGAKVLDPFAGGMERGFVACYLGHSYTGFDVRREQIDFNNNNCFLKNKPKWILDSSENLLNYVEPESQDFILSCPPYADLEVYSDQSDDISNLEYGDFKKVYGKIIGECYKALKPNRFAVFVVGEVRNKKDGIMYNFLGDTIELFKKSGFKYYNEIIILNECLAAALRAGRPMKTRKVTKVHQNAFVFYKGDNFEDIKDEFPVL